MILYHQPTAMFRIKIFYIKVLLAVTLVIAFLILFLSDSMVSSRTVTYRHAIKNHKRIASSTVYKREENSVIRDIFNLSEAYSLSIGLDNVTDKDKYVIYRCDQHTMSLCGGFADRILGAISGYMIANLTGRTFKIEMLFEHCGIHKFLVPNQVDWYLPLSFHEKVYERPGIAILNMIDNSMFMHDEDTDFQALSSMKSKYVYYKDNRESSILLQAIRRYRQQLSWMNGLDYAEINSALYRRLFKPSPYLQRQTKAFLAKHLQPEEKLLCAHVRFGRNPTFPQDTEVRSKKKYLPNVWEFLQQQMEYNNSKIFFMTDSEEVIEIAKQQPFKDKLIVGAGKPVHIDRSRHTTLVKCEGLEKVIFEQFILMHCDVLMISNSGLSRMAAYVRGFDRGLFCLKRTGNVVPCKRNNIRKIYKVTF